MCFSAHGRNLLTVSKTGGVSCWRVPYSNSSSQKKSVVQLKNTLHVTEHQLCTIEETPKTDLEQAIEEVICLLDMKSGNLS